MWASAFAAIVFLALYLGVPGYLLSRGWPLRAGLGMLLFTLFVLIRYGVFTASDDSEAFGFSLLLILILPLPLILTFVGLIAAAIRRIRNIHSTG